MRVAIDASCWSNRRGFGRYTRCLLEELVPLGVARGHDVVLVGDASTLDDPSVPETAEKRAVRVDAPPSTAAAAGGSRSVRDMVRMMRGFMRTRADVVFFPATYSFVPVPFTRLVVTAHDAIAERMPDLVVPRRSDRWRWAAKQHLALRQAKVVVTVSSAARDDLVDVLHVPPRRVRVVAEAAHPRFKPPAVSGGATPTSLGPVAGRPYFLYVGGFSPHKNLVALVRAFDRVADRDPAVALVLAGDIEDDPFLSSASEVQHAIAGARNRHRVRITGYVDDAELVSLYQQAVASVLVSFGEGFGLPVAESMACGTPVILSDEPALRENAGDAGYYVDPRDTSKIEAAMVDLLTDQSARERRVATGLLRSRERSWAHAAECVLSVLEEVAR